MKGTVIAYSTAANGGVLKAEDGKAYYFSMAEWLSKTLPATGLNISFSPSHNIARAINEPEGIAA